MAMCPLRLDQCPETAVGTTGCFLWRGGCPLGGGSDLWSVYDEFTGVEGASMVARDPAAGVGAGFATSGALWRSENGTWEIRANKAVEVSALNADKQLIILSGHGNISVSADITWVAGFVGLVVRYKDATTWAMGWYDGTALVMFQAGDGATGEIARKTVSWTSGDTHKMTLTAIGDMLYMEVVGAGGITGELVGSAGHPMVGLFDKSLVDTNAYDNFAAKPVGDT